MKKALRKQVLQELKSLSAEEKEVMDAWLTSTSLLQGSKNHRHLPVFSS